MDFTSWSQLIATELELDAALVPMSPTDSFAEVGWDSLQLACLVAWTEDATGQDCPSELVSQWATFEQAHHQFERHRGT